MGEGAEIVKGQAPFFAAAFTFLAKYSLFFLCIPPMLYRFSALTCRVQVATIEAAVKRPPARPFLPGGAAAFFPPVTPF